MFQPLIDTNNFDIPNRHTFENNNLRIGSDRVSYYRYPAKAIPTSKNTFENE